VFRLRRVLDFRQQWLRKRNVVCCVHGYYYSTGSPSHPGILPQGGIRKFVELGERIEPACQQTLPVNWRNWRIGTCERGVRLQPRGCLRHPARPRFQLERRCCAQEPAEC
jgi:hypothetical protein